MAPPPLSLAGFYQSLRWPTLRDLVFSLKAYFAVVLCLLLGFSQNLENPYWAGLTVYILLMQPESGAIRSKSFFRLIGTVTGGLLIMGITGLVANHLGIQLALVIAVIVLARFAQQIDRTPANYIWFSAGLTAGIIGLVNLQHPFQMFTYATARMVEITVGILAIAATDSLIWPRAMTPGFVKSLDEWCGNAREWVMRALQSTAAAPDDPDRRAAVRERLRSLTATVGTIDARAVQLPYDIVAAPPRSRDLRLLRSTMQQLIAALSAIELTVQAMRRVEGAGADLTPLFDRTAAWVQQSADRANTDLTDYTRDADALTAQIEHIATALAQRSDRRALLERAILLRMAGFINGWIDLMHAVRAVETRAPLPERLDRRARRAKNVRSNDYLRGAFDVAPMALALSISAVIYYLTAWDAGPVALLFSFVGCAFLGGHGDVLRSGVGIISWVLISFVLVFAYQFAVLPRVTDFPVLMAVLGVALIPLGVLLTMSLAPLLVAVYMFAFLSLQDVYAASFEQSLLSMSGALTGLLIAIASLHLCTYDRPWFTAKRLMRALRRDVADATSAYPIPDTERFVLLTIDRLAQFFQATATLEHEPDPLQRTNMLDLLRIGYNVLELRNQRSLLPPGLRRQVDTLLADLGACMREHARGKPMGDLYPMVERLMLQVAADHPQTDSSRLLASLLGLSLALGQERRSPPLNAAEGAGAQRSNHIQGNADASGQGAPR